MKKKLFMLLALVMTTMTASAVAGYTLSVGTSEHGTIAFTVNGQTRDYAAEGETVTVTITPDAGYVVNQPSGQWYAAVAKAPRRAAASIDLLKDVTFTAAGENQWTFEMKRANVEISSTYKKLLTNQDITVADIQALTYNGQAQTPTVSVQDGSVVLTEGTDYTLAYDNNVNVGTATVTATGIGNYTGTQTKTFTISPKTVGLSWGETTFDADGTEKQPTVEVTGLVGSDVCTATVTGTGTAVGNYTVTVTALSNANYALPETVSTPFAVVRDMSQVFAAGYGWATYVAQEDLALPQGIKAYTVSGATTTEVSAEAISYIPAGVGILLNRSDVSQASFKGYAYEGAKETIESKLVGSATAETDVTAYKDFVLYRDEFVLSAAASVAAAHAYLPAAVAPAGAPRRSITTGGDTTGISATNVTNVTNGEFYDLNGRKLVGKPTTKGIYIQNGKKVVIK